METGGRGTVIVWLFRRIELSLKDAPRTGSRRFLGYLKQVVGGGARIMLCDAATACAHGKGRGWEKRGRAGNKTEKGLQQRRLSREERRPAGQPRKRCAIRTLAKSQSDVLEAVPGA
jgi:hypothetical protein